MSLPRLMCDTVEVYCKSTVPSLMGGSLDILVYVEDLACHIQQNSSGPNSNRTARGHNNGYTVYFNKCPMLTDAHVLKIKTWAGRGEYWDGTDVIDSKFTRTLDIKGVRIMRGRNLCVWEVSAFESTTDRRFAYQCVIKQFSDGCFMMGDDGAVIVYESSN